MCEDNKSKCHTISEKVIPSQIVFFKNIIFFKIIKIIILNFMIHTCTFGIINYI